MSCFTLYILTTLFSMIYANCANKTNWMQYLPEDCGRTRYDNKTTRIVNGKAARLGEFPWMARLGRYKKKGSLFFHCGGVLVNRFYVISAAHCGEMIDIVRFGEHDDRTLVDCEDPDDCAPPHQDIKVKDFFMEDYCPISKTNDIMVIELEEPVTFNEFVQPACIPRDPTAYEDLPGDYLTLAGWGRIERYGKASNHLQYIRLKVLNTTSCMEIFRKFHDKGQICLQASDEGQNVCKGDSGGPAVKTMVVDGIRRAYAFGVAGYVKGPCIIGVVYNNILFYSDLMSKAIKKD